MNIEKRAAAAVKKIVEDLSDRRGLGQEWYQIDPEQQKEIMRVWADIVVKKFV